MTAWYNRDKYGVAHYSAPSLFDLSGTLAITPGFGATFSNPKDMVGGLSINVGINPAVLNTVYWLTGNLDISFDVGADLAAKHVLTPDGPINIYVSFANVIPMVVGPPWKASAGCPNPGWTKSSACRG